MPFSLFRTRVVFSLLVTLCFVATSQASGPVRDRAVLDLDMSKPGANAVQQLTDRAKAGTVADVVQLVEAPQLIASVFGNDADGQSLFISPARSQYVSVSSSADVSRPDAVTVSGLFASLHPESDAQFHGLFALRQPAGNSVSNYGINYVPSRDVFQLYVNDGSGYRVAQYSVKQVIGSRRRVHLTVCIDTADAPAADTDADADDIRVRLFVNGVPVAPGTVNQGLVDGQTGWFTDTTLEKCVVDTPLTIGASFAGAELAQLIVDDFLVFAESLTDEDAAALFREVAGPAADELLKEQQGTPPAAPERPRISQLSGRAVQIGSSMEIVVNGTMLDGAALHFSTPGVTAEPLAGGTAQRAAFRVSVDPAVTPSRCLLRVVGTSGVSDPVVFAVDRLPQVADGQLTRETPATNLPVAVSGVISGTEQKRVWFSGTSGQEVVVEVEARRIGSRLDPVVELKGGAGGPLVIQWKQPELGGDARAVAVLPEDGLYFAELHDVQYRAPRNSPFRLLLGTLELAALTFPGSTEDPAATAVLPGAATDASEPPRIVAASESQLPIPPLHLTGGTNVVEPIDGSFPETPIEATFTQAPFVPLAIWGRISERGQRDRIPIHVTPGQKLVIAAAARHLSSPLRPEILVFNGDSQLARSTGDTGSRDPSMTLDVPEAVEQLIVEVRDFTGQGSSVCVYRLDIARADRPGFRITVADEVVGIPANATVPLRLNVERRGESFQYAGPIRLAIDGMSGLRIVPDVIPSASENSEVLVALVRDELANSESSVPGSKFVIRAATEGLDVNVTSQVEVRITDDVRTAVAGRTPGLLPQVTTPAPALVSLDGAPPIGFRGTTTTLPIRILPVEAHLPDFVRFDLQTTQQPRRQDPAKADSPLLPVVAAADFQFAPGSTDVYPLQIAVPLDTPENAIDAAVAVDFIRHPLAADASRRAWTAPFQFAIRNAVELTPPPSPVILTVGGESTATPGLVRHPLFADAVIVRIDGLPGGVTSEPVTVGADQRDVRVLLKAAAEAAPGDLANVTLVVTSAAGQPLLPPVPLAVTVRAAENP